jgi:FOG: WD40-like repeat
VTKTQAAVEYLSDTWGWVTTPVLNDETVYFGSGLNDPRVHAVRVDTGQKQWTQRLSDFSIEPTLGIINELVIIAGSSGVHALDQETGEKAWAQPGGVGRTSSLAGVAVTNEAVYAALYPRSRQSLLLALDPATGDEQWARDIWGMSPPVVNERMVYFNSRETLYALDAATGETVWDLSVTPARVAPAVGSEMVYVASERGLVAADRSTGDHEWTHAGDFRNSGPAVGDSRLYLGAGPESKDGPAPGLVAVNPTTGLREWTFTSGNDAALQTPVVANGTVYAVSTNHRLYALEAATGELRWEQPFRWEASTPVVADENLLVNVGGRLVTVKQAGPSDLTSHPTLDPTADVSSRAYRNNQFYLGSQGYEIDASASAELDGEVPINASMNAVHGDDRVTFEFTLENTGDETAMWWHGPPGPLGVLSLRGEDNTGRNITAWTDTYSEGSCPHTTPHHGVTFVADVAIATTLAPGEQVEERYTVSPATHGIQPGSYRLEDEYGGCFAEGAAGYWADDTNQSWTLQLEVSADITRPAPDNGTPVFDLAVADEATVPAGFNGDLSMSVLEPITDTHPGLLEITLEGGSGKDGVGHRRDLPFGCYVGRSRNGSRLLLLPAETYAPAYVSARDDGADGWWQPSFLSHVTQTGGWGHHSLDAGDTFQQRYVVATHPNDDTPPSPGNYVFEDGYGDDTVEFTWGFVLSLLSAGE